MNNSNIQGVIITPLKKIPDERGAIFHIMKSTEKEFEKFGEVYLSKAYPQIIKGWHLHTEQTQNYVVIDGMIKLVLKDMRKNAEFNEIEEHFIGDLNYVRIKIPPGVANGYKCIGTETCTVVNVSDLPHKQGEMIRIKPNGGEIDYSWDVEMK